MDLTNVALNYVFCQFIYLPYIIIKDKQPIGAPPITPMKSASIV